MIYRNDDKIVRCKSRVTGSFGKIVSRLLKDEELQTAKEAEIDRLKSEIKKLKKQKADYGEKYLVKRVLDLARECDTTSCAFLYESGFMKDRIQQLLDDRYLPHGSETTPAWERTCQTIGKEDKDMNFLRKLQYPLSCMIVIHESAKQLLGEGYTGSL